VNINDELKTYNRTVLFAVSITMAAAPIYFIYNLWWIIWFATLSNILVIIKGRRVSKRIALKNQSLESTKLGTALEHESNERVRRAIHLFMCSNETTRKGIIVHGYGFTGKLTAARLHEHFHILDTKGVLGYFILDMEDDLEH